MNKRVIISVYNKNGIVEFVKKLKEFGYDIILMGGIMKYLIENGIEVINIFDVICFLEILDGRVKIFYLNIYVGIFVMKDSKEYLEILKVLDILLIDMVVVNFYLFKEIIFKKDVMFDDVIENIDIGGFIMI